MFSLALLLQVPVATVPGEVVDLTAEPIGHLVYATADGEVGRVDATGTVTLVSAAGSIASTLRGIHPTPAGDLLALDDPGNLFRLPSGAGPAELVYQDQFIVQFPTDLIVDASGVALIACKTISNNTYAVARVSPDGQEWAYWMVDHVPVGLAADEQGSVLFTDAAGFLQRLGEAHGAPATTALTATGGFFPATLDGDVVVEADGDAWFSAGASLVFYDAGTGLASTVQTAPSTIRGVAIAPDSSGAGHAVWYASGSTPTTIWEGPACDAPAAPFPATFGPVPDRGVLRYLNGGLNAFDMTADGQGDLLLSGDLWGANQQVRRVAVPEFTWATIAGPAEGIAGKVEGVQVGPDGAIYAGTLTGVVQRIDESGVAPVVETVFADPLDEVVRIKDMALGRSGQLYLADRSAYKQGAVHAVSPTGTLTTLAQTQESRGVAADPFAPRLLSTEWNSEGFTGVTHEIDVLQGGKTPLPGFDGLNMSNGEVWADGDLFVDARGDVYVTVEDDFSVLRYDREHQVLVRIAAGYLNRPAGLAIAPAVDPASSATGFSLYVAEWNRIWEVPDAPPPAPAWLDPTAPPAGELLGWVPPELGLPTDLIADPGSDDLLAVTDLGNLVRIPFAGGKGTLVAGNADGLSTDLSCLGAASSGILVTASRAGSVYRIDPAQGHAVVQVFADPSNLLVDVASLEVLVDGSILLLEPDPTAASGGRVWRLAQGSLQPLADTHHGQVGRIDPASGELWVLERGRVGEGGELLRIDLESTPARAGHQRLEPYQSFGIQPGLAGLAFDAAGNAYVAEGPEGRIHLLDRASGAAQTIAGNYDRPSALVVSTGRVGIAGAQGASLFVLHDHAVFEHGVDGAAPPTVPVDLGLPGPDLTAPARRVLPGFNAVRIDAPNAANLVHLVLAGLSGKEPGLPVFLPSGLAVLPLNYDPLFGFAGGAVLPGFLGALDGNGVSDPALGVNLPSGTSLASLGLFLDLAWVAIDVGIPELIGFVGGTAQVYLGE